MKKALAIVALSLALEAGFLLQVALPARAAPAEASTAVQPLAGAPAATPVRG